MHTNPQFNRHQIMDRNQAPYKPPPLSPPRYCYRRLLTPRRRAIGAPRAPYRCSFPGSPRSRNRLPSWALHHHARASDTNNPNLQCANVNSRNPGSLARWRLCRLGAQTRRRWFAPSPYAVAQRWRGLLSLDLRARCFRSLGSGYQ